MLFSGALSNHFKTLLEGKIFKDILHLIFPSKCAICSSEWLTNESICHFCKEELVYTNFESYFEPSELDKLFWGRVRVDGTFSLLYFSKNSSSTRKIVHSLKYQNRPETGVFLGKEIGLRIQKLAAFSDIDVLIPVPIHPKKRFLRGYNQSEQIAAGISDIISIPVDNRAIEKRKEKDSQTRKGKFERWVNVQDNFHVRNDINLFKHVAIVDDVITTGSTLESLIKAVHSTCPNLRISVISLALTK